MLSFLSVENTGSIQGVCRITSVRSHEKSQLSDERREKVYIRQKTRSPRNNSSNLVMKKPTGHHNVKNANNPAMQSCIHLTNLSLCYA